MIFGGVEDGYEYMNDSLGVCTVDGGEFSLSCGAGRAAAGKEGASEVADGGYDDGEIVATVPEAVVGCLVAEDLRFGISEGDYWSMESKSLYEHETDDD